MQASPKVNATDARARMPRFFEPLARNGLVTPDGVHITSGEAAMGPDSVRLVGSNPRALGVGECPPSSKSHYFIGKRSARLADQRAQQRADSLPQRVSGHRRGGRTERDWFYDRNAHGLNLKAVEKNTSRTSATSLSEAT
jgi:hypothetical protein